MSTFGQTYGNNGYGERDAPLTKGPSNPTMDIKVVAAGTGLSIGHISSVEVTPLKSKVRVRG